VFTNKELVKRENQILLISVESPRVLGLLHSFSFRQCFIKKPTAMHRPFLRWTGILSGRFRLLPCVFLFLAITVVLMPAKEEKETTAPATDRVGFPADYSRKFIVLRTKLDAANAKQITIYGNAETASVSSVAALPYPNGSIIVMETTSLKKGPDGKALTDLNGKYLQDLVLGLHVMRREAGFGAAYGANRSGEWEYVEYRADGSFITPPQKSATCAECHLKAGKEKDYVFKARFADSAK
jgi:hypothetical protein